MNSNVWHYGSRPSQNNVSLNLDHLQNIIQPFKTVKYRNSSRGDFFYILEFYFRSHGQNNKKIFEWKFSNQLRKENIRAWSKAFEKTPDAAERNTPRPHVLYPKKMTCTHYEKLVQADVRLIFTTKSAYSIGGSEGNHLHNPRLWDAAGRKKKTKMITK